MTSRPASASRTAAARTPGRWRAPAERVLAARGGVGFGGVGRIDRAARARLGAEREDDVFEGRANRGGRRALVIAAPHAARGRARSSATPAAPLTARGGAAAGTGKREEGSAPMPLKLIIANKAYSSWSLRPWILLAHFKIPFEETVIPLDLPETRALILEHSPTGKCSGAARRRDHGVGIAGDRRICRRDSIRRRRSGRAARRREPTRARSPPKCTPASRRCASIARPISVARCAKSR